MSNLFDAFPPMMHLILKIKATDHEQGFSANVLGMLGVCFTTDMLGKGRLSFFR